MTVASDALAARLRPLLPAGLEEKRMFGGLGFLVAGNMAIGTTAAGDLLVRIAPDGMDTALRLPGAFQMMMGERPMSGFVAVRGDALVSQESIAGWIARGIDYARTLPAK